MKPLLFVLLAALLLGATANAADVALYPGAGGSPPASTDEAAITLTFGEDIVLVGERLPSAGGAVLAADVPAAELFLVTDQRVADARLGYETLYENGGLLLARVEEPELLAHEPRVHLRPVRASATAIDPPHAKGEPDPVVEGVLAMLDKASYEESMRELSVDLDTRMTCSDQVLDARDVIAQEFADLGLEVTLQPFHVGCGANCRQPKGYNVIGFKRGSVRPDEYYLVGGHYDSTSQNSCELAPGSNDNASGTAGVMELARVFAPLATEASLVFVAFAGEEQGLLGSFAFARALNRNGLITQFKNFVIMDMISVQVAGRGLTLWGGNRTEAQRAALQEAADAARTYTDLDVKTIPLNMWDSDHSPLLAWGMAGSMMIEASFLFYPAYHTVNDTIEKQNFAFGLEATKVAAAVMAAGAVVMPSPPDDDDDATDDDDDDDGADDDDDDDDDDQGAGGDDDDDAGCGC